MAVVFALAIQYGFPLWPIHLIWIAATVIDTYIGFAVGAFLKKKFRGTEFLGWLEKYRKMWLRWTGKYGSALSLGLLGIIDFPYINGFLAAWLDLPMNLSVLLTLAGNFVWYILIWGTVLGISSIFSNPTVIILIIIFIGVLSSFFFPMIQNRARRK
jgi:hypothetical protein